MNKKAVNEEKPKLKRQRVSIVFTDPSETKQEFKQETDINYIIAKFTATGVLPERKSKPLYADFSKVPDFRTYKQIVVEAEEAFMELPSELRAKFDNDPAKMMAWAADPRNTDKASDLGLVGTPEPVKTVDTEALSDKKEIEKDAKK